MTSTIQNESTTTTCPWWCTARSVHHLRWDRALPWPQAGEMRFHGQDISEHVAVWGAEHRDAEHGPTSIDVPLVYVVDMEDAHLTTTEARQHAADVLTAADLIDRVVAGR